ncbi:hypothetical protein BC833DRAFT_92818 [Globomyces pollinis-pini]|nr:hypothetical protein BC833DRAFT_92818 [Globomyces pollinis-pini]
MIKNYLNCEYLSYFVTISTMFLWFMLPLLFKASPTNGHTANLLTGSGRKECEGPRSGNLPAVRFAPWRIPIYLAEKGPLCSGELNIVGYVPANKKLCIRSRLYCSGKTYCELTDQRASTDQTGCPPPDYSTWWVECKYLSCSDPTSNCYNYCYKQRSVPSACTTYDIWNPYLMNPIS